MKKPAKLFSLALPAAFLMTTVFSIPAIAEIFIMKDGVRLEGDIAGRTDSSLLVKTKYGDLILKQADIKQIVKESSTGASTAQTETENVEIVSSSSLSEDQASYVFSTVVAEDGSAKIYYFRDKNIIATETLDSNAKLIGISGTIPDRTFTEYYDNSKVKTVKPMKNGKQNGTVMSYYKDGTRQFIANYKDGLKDGKFSFYTAKGTLMIEAEYKNDKLNGAKKDYKADGTLDKITWYKDDEETEAPSETSAASMPSTADTVALPAAATGSAIQNTEAGADIPASNGSATAITADSAVADVASNGNTGNTTEKAVTGKSSGAQTAQNKKGHSISVKARKVARGTMYSFYVNNRYTGKARLDANYNVLMTDGKIPDGTARLYGINDIIQLEFIFRKGEIISVTVFDKEGNEAEHYIINEKRLAVKAGL